MPLDTDPRQIQLIMELRGQGIADVRVLDAIERTPRARFIDAPLAYAAYNNTALPIACGQTISQPFVVAYMTEHLDVQPSHRVLEIGTGSGYQAAVLSPLCRRVYTVERHKALFGQAKARFQALGLHNIATKLGDGFGGWPEQAPFDRILLACAVETVPLTLIEQLKPGGALIAPVGDVPKSDNSAPLESFSQRLQKIVRTEAGVTEEILIPVLFVPMLSGLP